MLASKLGRNIERFPEKPVPLRALAEKQNSSIERSTAKEMTRAPSAPRDRSFDKRQRRREKVKALPMQIQRVLRL